MLAGRGAQAGGRGGGAPKMPTEAQWAAMPPKAKEYVDKARAIAGTDPDLQFDFGIFCKASGGAQNPDRATIGVPNSEPKLQPFPAPSPAQVLGGLRLFDNFYWIGNTGIGAWLVTSDDGYILFDAMNSEEDARDIIIPAIKKLNLDPMKIKYLVFGHDHFDHTGGGEYIQRMTGAKAIMGRDDWDIYLRRTRRAAAAADAGGRGGAGAAARPTPAPPAASAASAAAPAPKMKRDIDATDGMEITIGNKQKVTATIFSMTGHTPGSIGMVVPVRYQNREHPILLVTAGTDINNRAEFIGGYEHIWDMGIKMKVENGDAVASEHEHEPPGADEVRERQLSAGEEPAALRRRARRRATSTSCGTARWRGWRFWAGKEDAMTKRILAGVGVGVAVASVAVWLHAQTPTPPQGGTAPAGGQGAAGAQAGGRGRGNYPTTDQWSNMPASAKAFVDKATQLAGNDPDLKFDMSIFCQADGGASGVARASLGVPASEPKLQPYGAPNPRVSLGGQKLFDNLYWFGDTGVGAFLITTNDGYILWDALNNEAEARDVLVPSMKKLGLDPTRIRYMAFGHHHGDHTGGGEYIQRMYHPKVIMGRDDWALYLRGNQGGGRGGRGAAAAAWRRRAGTGWSGRTGRTRCECGAAGGAHDARPRRRGRDGHPGRRRQDDDLPDDRPHAGIDRRGRAGEVARETSPDSDRDRRERRPESALVRRRLRAHLGRGPESQGRIRDAGAPEHEHEHPGADEIRQRQHRDVEVESAPVRARAHRAVH